MIVFMTAGLPFSVWRSDSLAQWLQYTVKIYPLLFFICAAAVTVAHCEKLLYAQIIAGGIVLVLTAILGRSLDGRLVMLGGSLMNPNALSLQLILAACSFVYLLYLGRGMPYTVLGLLGMFICAALVFRTGSRGGFLAVVGAIVAVYFTIRQASTKFKMLALLGVLGLSAIVAAAANPIAFKRLTDITLEDRAPSGSEDVLYAGSSQMAREELLRYGVELTLTHPLLGVGLGEFPVAVDNGARQQGKKSSWNGTHNSYLQLSSECGIPAALCYTLVLLISIRTSRKLYREFSLRPGEEKIAGIALTLFAALVSLAIALFFFHLAYTYYVPVFCGMTLALNAAAANRRELAR
jgi:O-antigen ligase